MGLLHQYFGFSGRINRAKFWKLNILLIVFSIIATFVAIIAAFLILGGNLTNGELPDFSQPEKFAHLILDYVVALAVLVGVSIVVWVSTLAVAVKRLHDRNKRGWWILLFYVAPLLLAGVVENSENDTTGAVAALLALVLLAWALIELGFRRGTGGPNRFGADPLERPNPAAAG